MKTLNQRQRLAIWLLVPLLVARAAFGNGADVGATLAAKGVTVDGTVCSETERRDFADGLAVRYVLPDGERHIEREETVWTLPTDAKVWYQEYGGDYEKPYSSSLVREIPVGTVVNLPVTAKLADGTYRLITEANVVGYTDSAAKYLGNGRFTVFYVNEPQGFTQTAAKGTPLPGTTPWRVMLVAKDIQTLATSDIVRRLCPDPSPEVAAKAAAFVKPGRAVWQWLPAGNPKYEEQKEWFDCTKKLGFEYYLIDAGWRDWQDGDMDQWACLKKWIDYGKSIGVESFIWVHSKELMDPAARRAYLAKVKATGAVGIKIDFHPAAKCAQMAWYEETLAETLEFSLMTDFHGAVKPSGREKTWPHEVAREAIRGHEWHITRYNRVLPPEHDCILPFNRLVQGHADYTPVVFEKKELVGYTWARELAQGVVFSAPFLCFGDYPKNYLENPAAELIKAMPATYDETRVLAGSEIGECVAVAKRKGKDWFIAVENGASARKLSVDLGFLGKGKCNLTGFADADDRPDGYRIERRVVDRSGKIELALRPSGGYCARIAPEGESSSANDGGGSGEFVAAARRAYAGDPMCRTTIVTNFAVRGKPDDKTPGLVLWYDVEGARNVRDIGGWTGLRTRRVFRGTALNSKPNHRQYELTERGRAVMRGEMGRASDLDLRGEIAEYGEDAKTKSPIGEGVQLLSRPVSSYVETCTSPRSAKAFAAALRVFADEKNYPVYVHCAGGADRTGTVCFLLETLCGVSLEDATIEYELTSFSPVGVRRRDSETGLPFALMVRLLSSFPGETFNDKVAYWAENVAGLSKDEIERIRLNLVNRQ